MIVKFAKQGNELDIMIWTPVSKLRELLAKKQHFMLDRQLCHNNESLI